MIWIKNKKSNILKSGKKPKSNKVRNCSKRLNMFFEFLKQRKFLCLIVLFNIIAIPFIAILFKESIIKLIFFISFIVISSCFAIAGNYIEEYNEWLNRAKKSTRKIIDFISYYYIFLLPLLSFGISIKLSEAILDKKITTIENIFYVLMLILQVYFIIKYCKELGDISKNKSNLKHKIIWFSFLIVHIIQLFANIYILLYLDNNSFSGVLSKTPFELAFDMTYFSAMTFLTADGLITPVSKWSKLVVAIESLILTVYISVIIFGVIADDKSSNDE